MAPEPRVVAHEVQARRNLSQTTSAARPKLGPPLPSPAMRLSCLPLFLLLGCPAGPGDGDPTPGPADEFDTLTRTDRPAKRSEAVAVADPESQSILLFGGNDGPIVSQIPRAAYRDDSWIFEPGLGWIELDVQGPSARGRTGSTLDRAGGRALVFGGRYRPEEQTGDYTLFDDLWAFDFASRTWSQIDDGGSGPSPRFFPAVQWSDEEEALYVYGGFTNTDALVFQSSRELWRWTEAGWEELDWDGDAPSARGFFGSTIDQDRKRILLFAGQVGDFQSLAFNDLFALDLSTRVWTELDGGGDGAPFTRMHPHLLWDEAGDRALLFGGHTDIGDGNDLWVWEGEGGPWSLVRQGDSFTGEPLGCIGNPAEVPADYVEQDLDSPERRQKAMVVSLAGSLWVFGGMHAECSEHLDDTWRFDLAAGTWHELLPARTGESCLRRGDDCECLCL